MLQFALALEVEGIHVAGPECPPVDQGGPIDRPCEPFPYSALEGSISDRFDATAGRFSERTAHSDCVGRLTYADLAILVDRIADAVADRPGPVAILLSSDLLFPAAMLGVLAAGRGFVPLDAGDPIERIRGIATKSGAAAVVTTGDLARGLAQYFRQTCRSSRSKRPAAPHAGILSRGPLRMISRSSSTHPARSGIRRALITITAISSTM